MITSKQQLREYLLQDAKANYRTTLRVGRSQNYIWKWIKCIRHLDYYHYKLAKEKSSYTQFRLFIIDRCISITHQYWSSAFHTQRRSARGAQPHYGTIIINRTASIGEQRKKALWERIPK